jgi:flagella basal body P-ring formation protein FlgA
MIVTNGVVEFERVTRPADYESKRGKVSLSFAVEDSEDAEAVVERVGAMAMRRALTMVGEVLQGEVVQPRRVTKTPPKPVTEEVPDPTVPGAEAVSDAVSTSTVEELKPVTDAMLDAAVHKARAKNIMPDQIKAEILKFTGQPGVSMKSLDQEKRPLLIAAIEALRAT